MSDLTYRPHQARRVRALAKVEEFQDADGKPNFVKLSQEVGISAACVRYLLTGELPEMLTKDVGGDTDDAEDMFA